MTQQSRYCGNLQKQVVSSQVVSSSELQEQPGGWKPQKTMESGSRELESAPIPTVTVETLKSAFWPFLDVLVQIYEQAAVDKSRPFDLQL